MPVSTPSLLASGFTTATDPAVTSSVTPTAGATVLIGIGCGNTTVVGVTGNSLTWTQVDTVADGDGRHLYVFRASGTPTTGTISIDLALARNCLYSIVEITGTDTTTNNGVVQFNHNTAAADSVSTTLSALASSDNATVGYLHSTDTAGVSQAISPGGSYTELDEAQGAASGIGYSLSFEYLIAGSTTVNGTAAAGNDNLSVIGMEIAVATAVGYPKTIVF